MSFEDNIRKWIQIDNAIKEKQLSIKQLKIEKEQYNENILEYLNENNLENATIKIGDGKLRLVESNHPETLTYKFICESLCEYFREDEDHEELVKEIIIFIKERRNIKTLKEIKRYGICS
tara:strand:+ start:208 stop:567 length:360 start_codon:yes stop_codon:yes gene_type:complete